MTTEQRKEQQQAAQVLLDKAPVLDAAKFKLEKEEFIKLARGVAIASSSKINSSKQAIKVLEDIIRSTGSTTATLKSNPDKNDVRYRRYVDDNAPWQNATTNTQVSLRPALYVFRCTDKKSGKTLEKTQSCTTDCTVEFDF
jgi:hypothetical protein